MKDTDGMGFTRFDGENYSTLGCVCGSSFTWEGFNDSLHPWMEAHRPHLKQQKEPCGNKACPCGRSEVDAGCCVGVEPCGVALPPIETLVHGSNHLRSLVIARDSAMRLVEHLNTLIEKAGGK